MQKNTRQRNQKYSVKPDITVLKINIRLWKVYVFRQHCVISCQMGTLEGIKEMSWDLDSSSMPRCMDVS